MHAFGISMTLKSAVVFVYCSAGFHSDDHGDVRARRRLLPPLSRFLRRISNPKHYGERRRCMSASAARDRLSCSCTASHTVDMWAPLAKALSKDHTVIVPTFVFFFFFLFFFFSSRMGLPRPSRQAATTRKRKAFPTSPL